MVEFSTKIDLLFLSIIIPVIMFIGYLEENLIAYLYGAIAIIIIYFCASKKIYADEVHLIIKGGLPFLKPEVFLFIEIAEFYKDGRGQCNIIFKNGSKYSFTDYGVNTEKLKEYINKRIN